MALQPDLRAFIVAGSPDAPHTMDIFSGSNSIVRCGCPRDADPCVRSAVDFICPYSAKMGLAIDTFLRKAFAPGGQYAGKVKIILRQQVQPWHASGLFLHEAALAVRLQSSRVDP